MAVSQEGGCEGCADQKRLAELTEPVRWDYAAVWERDNAYIVCSTIEHFEKLSDTILGAIGVRSDGTTDWLSGSDWYGWIPFQDDWRLSGIQGSRDEMLRVAVRYPGSVWKEGILVSDAEMQRVNAEMRAYVESVR